MSDTVADDLIRSYFERWERLEEEKRTVSDDLKELFAEARGNGLDTKALRAVFREQVGDQIALNEFDAICDLYRTSLNRPRARRAREAQESSLEQQGESDAKYDLHRSFEKSDLIGRRRQESRKEECQTSIQSDETPAGSAADEIPAPNPQSAATPLPADMPEAEPQVPQSVSGSPSDGFDPSKLWLSKQRNTCDVVGAE